MSNISLSTISQTNLRYRSRMLNRTGLRKRKDLLKSSFLAELVHQQKKKKNSGTDEQDVDVSSDAGSIFQHLLHTAQQHAKDRLLYVLVAVDAGGQGASQLIKHILRKRRKGRVHFPPIQLK